jgi:hypothetical protein
VLRARRAGVAARATAAFERYGERWEQLEADACTAERAAPTRLATLRRACLDERIAALRTLVDVMTTDDRAEVVDHALDMVRGLPDVADCADAESLLAGPDAPPSDFAVRIAPISAALVVATAQFDAGDREHAEPALVSIVARAHDAGWLPLELDARFALARLRLAKIQPVREELVAIASLATENRLDRRAVRAWIEALRAASTERSQTAVATLASIAIASARRVRDPELVIEAEVEHGGALGRIGKWDRAEAICRGALDEALAKLGAQATATGAARDCVFEALVPLGKWDALAPLAAERIDTATRELGADHPKTIDYLSGLVYLRVHEGKLAEAHAIAERALAARRRTSAPDSLRVAEALYLVSAVEQEAKRNDDARTHYRDALAIAERAPLDPMGIRARIHQGLAELAHAAGDHAEELAQERAATELIRAALGPDSLDLATALARYGQWLTNDDLEAGVREVDQARAIFERAGDRRALLMQAIVAGALVNHAQLARARPILERIVADPAYAQVFDEWNRTQVEHALALAKQPR